jgi:DNA polymerase III epsilon subunit-like protein
MSGVAFVDTETTGLDPAYHEIWEVAAIIDDHEWVWQLPVAEGRADPIALNVGHYHERRLATDQLTHPKSFAKKFAELTRGRHLVGAVVSFDAERLSRLLRRNGRCPMWHYHLVDVEALAVGFLAGQGQRVARPPWSSEGLTEALGLPVPTSGERHTALGDARWAKSIYERIMRGGV